MLSFSSAVTFTSWQPISNSSSSPTQQKGKSMQQKLLSFFPWVHQSCFHFPHHHHHHLYQFISQLLRFHFFKWLRCTWHDMACMPYAICPVVALCWCGIKKVPKKLRTYLRVCTTTRSIFQMKKRENTHMFLFLTKEYGQQWTTKMKQFVSYFF